MPFNGDKISIKGKTIKKKKKHSKKKKKFQAHSIPNNEKWKWSFSSSKHYLSTIKRWWWRFCSILFPPITHKGRERGRGGRKKRKKRNVGGKFANGFYPIPFNEGLSTEEREIDIDLRLCKLPILVHYSLWSSTRARCYKGGCGLFNNVVAACRIIFWYHPAWIGDSIEIDELLIGRSGSSHKITHVNRENSSRSRFNSVIDKSIRLNL